MVDVRPAEPADVPAIRRVARGGWHAAYDDRLGADAVDAVVDDWYAPETVREYVTDDDVVYLVAADDPVVGYAAGGPDPDAAAATARLGAIYVRPDRWREGIGGRLLEELTDRLADRGFERLRIDVLAANDVGRAFYERQGFEAVARGEVELAGTVCGEVTYAGPL
ncbi:GNAT family N-acetyltransferase [Halomicrobium salinisoli]|uniref:GNAT family N-acetyltransferase n=1 Tax=Halomicrobium salinisoli TaxID=2878391 RepID=UPI001CEFDCB9|nr:GNAT family N-acetyltransferase [Halomicrobium salinisoli]